MPRQITGRCQVDGCQGKVGYQPEQWGIGMFGECDTCGAQFHLEAGVTTMTREPSRGD